MSDPDMQKFTSALEKLCADCAGDVFKLISNCRAAVSTRMGKLQSDIEKLAVPNSAPGDLAKVPELVNGYLKKGGSRFASVATFGVRVEVSKNKLSVPASGISGPLAGVV